VVSGSEPDCDNDAAETCAPVAQNSNTPGIWNPLAWFDTVKADNQLGNIQSAHSFYTSAESGTIPAVSSVVPSAEISAHPPFPVSYGQSNVTGLINAVMNSPDRDSTAIFLVWTTGVASMPRRPADRRSTRLRPSRARSRDQPLRKARIHRRPTLSFDAYDKFIEDGFLNGRRLDPATNGQPDPRPTVRENVAILGHLTNEM